MRLSEHDRRAIREAIAEVTGPGARVLLFGSRVRDDLKGGDIDLLIELDEPVEHPALVAARVGAAIERRIGERKVDVLIDAPNVRRSAVHEAARATGIVL